MCIEGFGPSQIARKLSEQQVLIPTAYFQSKGQSTPHTYKKPYRWCENTVAKILESMEYVGHTVNFKSQIKNSEMRRGQSFFGYCVLCGLRVKNVPLSLRKSDGQAGTFEMQQLR